jgi:hypothetical protein
MSDDRLREFVLKHIARKLAKAGASIHSADLNRLVAVERRALPAETEASSEGDAQRLTRFSVYSHRADIGVDLNANTGTTISWLCSKLADGNSPPTEQEAFAVAEAAADLPQEAVLAFRGFEDVGGSSVFIAQWEHREDGVSVESDYVRVLVSGRSGRVFAVQRHWHQVDLAATER